MAKPKKWLREDVLPVHVFIVYFYFSSHNRIRRPNRGSYQDRNRRYSPNRHRHTASAVDSRYNGPYGEDVQAVPYKYEERDNERLKEDHSAFMLYCKKRGIC